MKSLSPIHVAVCIIQVLTDRLTLSQCNGAFGGNWGVTSYGEVGCDRTGASGKGLAQVDLQPTNANESAITRTNSTKKKG